MAYATMHFAQPHEARTRVRARIGDSGAAFVDVDEGGGHLVFSGPPDELAAFFNRMAREVVRAQALATSVVVEDANMTAGAWGK
jgi:hypothetical protein